MPMKVNYGFQRGERDRAKQAKKEAKAREKSAARASEEPVAETTPPEAGKPSDTE